MTNKEKAPEDEISNVIPIDSVRESVIVEGVVFPINKRTSRLQTPPDSTEVIHSMEREEDPLPPAS